MDMLGCITTTDEFSSKERLIAELSAMRFACENAIEALLKKYDNVPVVWKHIPSGQSRDEIKGHIIAQLVNELSDIAVKYHDHQSLRDRLADPVHRVWKGRCELFNLRDELAKVGADTTATLGHNVELTGAAPHGQQTKAQEIEK